ncbi:MAG TPA: recombinase family protein [Candidatus Cybelea sp.]|nr:recombinase family protein [Candidatus Cybelea sp.]
MATQHIVPHVGPFPQSVPAVRVALYLRVSTDEQETENQAIQLREFAAKQGWQIVREYCDYESGSRSDRAEFQRMFDDASRRKVDMVLFWALDRLSREGVLKTLQYLNQLTGYGVGWRSFTQQYLDSTGMFRDAIIGILAALAQQERVQRAERTRAGLARVRAAGRRLGRPVMLNGQHRAEIARLRASGLSLRAIGRQLGISDGSVRRLASAAAQ